MIQKDFNCWKLTNCNLRTAWLIFFKYQVICFLRKFSDGIHFLRKAKEKLKHDFSIRLVTTVTTLTLNVALNDDLKIEKASCYC